ncbi:MAG: BTAD domain-containing putative transcriptional regulator [Gemmatimonadaceae bacterium]
MHLRTLGRFELVAGEAPALHVVAAQPKRLALLAYLAIASPGGAHRRDSLLALFWPELNTDESRRALRQALHALRQFLDEGMLESRRDDQVALVDDRDWCDVVAFDRAIEARQFEEALALYQGPFLDGVFISDVSADFEQWVGNTRNRLAIAAMRAANALAEQARVANDERTEVRWATAATRLQPEDEASVRRLMQALDRSGDRPQALRVFEAFQARLLSELGAKPSSDTMALVQLLRTSAPRTKMSETRNEARIETRSGTRSATPGAPLNETRGSARNEPHLERGNETPVDLRDESSSESHSTTSSKSFGEISNEKSTASKRVVSAQMPNADAAREDDSSTAPEKPNAESPAGDVAKHRLGVRWRVIAGIATALVLSLAVYAWRQSIIDAKGAAERILIADFRNGTHDELLAVAVTEALRADFSQSRRAHVLSRQQVQGALLRMQQPGTALLTDSLVHEMAEREGVKAFVTGDIVALGNGFSVSAALISVHGGTVLASVREVARDSTELIGAVDRVSSALRRGAGESLWSVRASPTLEQVTTGSLEALRLYSEAVKVGDQDGDRAGAIPLLRQAVAKDTMFAMAYRKLGAYLGNFRESAAADSALRRALRYRDRLPEKERYLTLGAFYDQSGMPDSALAAYRTLLQIDPTNTIALNNTAAQYVTLRDFRKAEQFRRRALETDSSLAVLYVNLANDQFNAGELDAVEQTLAIRAKKFASKQDVEAIHVSVAMARGEFVQAEKLTREMLRVAGNDLGGQSAPLRMLSLELLIAGRLAESEQFMHAYMKAQVDSPGEYLEGAILLAFEQVVYRHDAAQSIKTIDDALARTPLDSIAPLDRHYAFLAYVLALSGAPARSRTLLAAFRANDATTPGSGVIRDESDYLRAEGAALAYEHKYSEAIATFVRAGTALNDYVCPVCALPDLAAAYDKAGQPDSAIAVYRRYVTTPWTDWMMSDGEFRSLAWRRLGELYQAQGDTRRAILALQTVEGLWQHADAAVQPDLADVRARLVLLRAKAAH